MCVGFVAIPNIHFVDMRLLKLKHSIEIHQSQSATITKSFECHTSCCDW